MDVDITEERRGMKRTATTEAAPSSSARPEESATIPLSLLSYQGVNLFNITELFDLTKPELGRGVYGIVYKGTVTAQHEIRAHLPPWLKTETEFAIKVSNVTLPTKDRPNVTEAQINLLLAQSAEMPKHNIISCLYWMRAINDVSLPMTPLSMSDVTVMELATGGSLGHMFKNDSAFDVLVRSNMKKSITSMFAQYVAGLAAAAFVLGNFMQIDVHEGNIFCKRTATPTYFVYALGNGQVLLAPTWLTNNYIIALGDFGAAYGVGRTTEGGQVVGRIQRHTTDYNRLARIIIEQYSDISDSYTKLVRKTYEDLLFLLTYGGPPTEQLAPYADEIRAEKAAATSWWIFDAGAVWAYQQDYVEGAQRLSTYIDALEQQSSLSSYSSAVESVVDRLKQARAPLEILHESYMVMRQVNAFAQTGSVDALYVLRQSPFFDALRTKDDPTSIAALRDKLLLSGMQSASVEPVRVELEPPPDRPKVEYVHSRLQ